MKKYILSITLITWSIISVMLTGCEKKDPHTFTLQGIIAGDTPQEIILKYVYNDSSIYDTARIIDGRFLFKGKIQEPTLANINLVDEELWIEPGMMELNIDLQHHTHQLKGSQTEDDKKSYYNHIDSLIAGIRPYMEQMQHLSDSLKSTKGQAEKKQLKEKLMQLQEKIKAQSGSTLDMQKHFIQKHPGSFFSSYLLYPINAGEIIPIDSCIVLYNLLSKEVQNGEFGRKIAKDIKLISHNRQGEPAPLFEAFDSLHNRTVTLSDMKGKVVIMDFWAPWCAPCRWGFKNLKSMYQKYHSKGLEIIAVYTDKKEDSSSWKKAIHDDGVENWHQIKIAENMEPGKETAKDIRALYYVQAIPRKILIDKQGNIVKIWVGVNNQIEEEVENMVKEELLK